MLAIVDIETTGLIAHADWILEIAILLVEDDLTIVQEMPAIQIIPSPSAKLRMDDFVRNMHRESGLFDDIREKGIHPSDAHLMTSAWVRDWIPADTPMAGNSVHFDRAFLKVNMPNVEEHFHYRNVDASSVREMAHRWTPRLTDIEPKAQGKHRALSDCYDSLNLLKFYKEHLFTRPT